eukprot:1593710-Pyramimonas_sp.AAC.1
MYATGGQQYTLAVVCTVRIFTGPHARLRQTLLLHVGYHLFTYVCNGRARTGEEVLAGGVKVDGAAHHFVVLEDGKRLRLAQVAHPHRPVLVPAGTKRQVTTTATAAVADTVADTVSRTQSSSKLQRR